jgi:protein-tyrosine phosphatase
MINTMRIKILFVCLGNICRSPLAEAILKNKIVKKGWTDFIEVDSCGTSNYHIGSNPDERTQENALKNGITMHHRARQITQQDLAYFDFIVAMDRNNREAILKLDWNKVHEHKVVLMRSFGTEVENDVPDPYYGGEQGFQEVFEILDRSTDAFLNILERQYSLAGN